MANPYYYDGPDTRWEAGQATTLSRLNIARESIDYLKYALSVLMDTDAAAGLAGSWDNPLVLRASANAFGSLWLDDSDPANIVWRTKTATTRAGTLPAGISQGVRLAVAR